MLEISLCTTCYLWGMSAIKVLVRFHCTLGYVKFVPPAYFSEQPGNCIQYLRGYIVPGAIFIDPIAWLPESRVYCSARCLQEVDGLCYLEWTSF